jgi:peptidoglycan-N-acetylmuramic acid deacetylase
MQVNLVRANQLEPGPYLDSDNFMDSLTFYRKPFCIVPPETPYCETTVITIKNETSQPGSPTISGTISLHKKAKALNKTARNSSTKNTGKKTRRLASSRKNKYKSNTLAGRLFGNNRFSKYHLDRVPTSSKIITLSFDGDHLNNCVAPVLEILDKNGVKANIFLTGKFIQLFPESVLAIYRAGHEIGNHSWNHPHLTQYEQNRTQKTRPNITRDYFLSQLQRTSDAYVQLTGSHFQPFWRAPFGEHNLQIRTWAYSAGYLHIGWTRGYDTMDWMIDPRGKYYLSPQKLEKKLLDDLKNPGHKIILMHLGSKRPDPSQRPYTILNDFIAKAREKGYRFSTVSDVMKENAGFQMASGTP